MVAPAAAGGGATGAARRSSRPWTGSGPPRPPGEHAVTAVTSPEDPGAEDPGQTPIDPGRTLRAALNHLSPTADQAGPAARFLT